MSSRVYLLFPPRGHEPPPTLRDRLNPHLSLLRRSLSSPPLCQTPGCRSARNRSTISPSHPVLSALHPQGFQTRFALAAARRSFGLTVSVLHLLIVLLKKKKKMYYRPDRAKEGYALFFLYCAHDVIRHTYIYIYIHYIVYSIVYRHAKPLPC